MKKSGKKLCGAVAVFTACATVSVALVGCGLFGDDGDGEKCTVSFDAGWGTVFGDRFYETEVDVNSLIAEPSEKPVYEGYFFTGWNLTGDARDAMWNFDADKVTGDITLCAVWARGCTVTFNANGGTFDNGEATYKITVAENSKLTAPQITAPDGYRKLDGWQSNLSYGLWDMENDIAERDMTLTAKWSLKDDVVAALRPFGFSESNGEFTIVGVSDKTTTSVTVPDFVTHIGRAAFENCTELVSVVIPDSVKTIGDSAFEGCAKLKSVTLPVGLTEIGARTFSNCAALESIDIPDTLTELGDAAFTGCSSLKTIELPVGVTEIGYSAFEDCTALESVVLNGAVTAIGASAFENCAALESFDIPAGVKGLPDSCFRGCASLTSVTVPTACASIGWSAFQDCTGLVSVDINSQTIGIRAFSGCTALAEVTIGATVTKINSSAFSSCTALTEIDIPDAVTELGSDAFSGCSSLKRAALGDGVTTLAYGLFSDCYALRDVTFGEIAEIGEKAFSGCVSLTSFTVPASVTEIESDAFYGCARLVEIYNLSASSVVKPYSYTTIHTALTDPSVIKNAGDYAFCSIEYPYDFGHGEETFLLDYLGNDENIVLPDSFENDVYGIADYALACNARLKSVEFSAGVSRIKNNVLFGSANVTTLTVASGNSALTAENNCVIHTSENKFVLGCKTSVIPTDGSVTTVGSYVFCQNAAIALADFKIPSSVTVVESNAFAGCEGIIRTAENGVRYVDKWAVALAYRDGNDMFDLRLDDGTVGISASAFGTDSDYGIRRRIASVAFNAELKYVNDSAFFGCDRLTAVTLNDGLLKIDRAAFGSCDGLTEIEMPDSVTYIGPAAFMSCDKLAYVKLSKGITTIEHQAFDACKALRAVVIPSDVTKIAHDVFGECPTDMTVYYGGDESEWQKISVDNGNSVITSSSAHIVYYSETSQSGRWHFGADGKPELWQ